MANAADPFARRTLLLACCAALIAAWAAFAARSSGRPVEPTEPRRVEHAITSLDRPGRFWIGAWCPPPARATTAEAWRRFAAAGLDVGIYPLEDHFRRDDNLRRLVLLDSLHQADPTARRAFVCVRDDSLHPDETLRPGWQGRLERVRATYARFASCAGIFLADEPHWETLATYAPIARGLGATAENGLVPFVNYAGLPAHPTFRDRPRFRSRLAASVRDARLGFFTVDAYSATVNDVWPNSILTLADAAQVARETGVDFGALIQLTGHGPFVPATPGLARAQVFLALAYGARAVIWFTYWTPNPAEAPWHWHDGMVDYATGVPTRQYAMVAAVNVEARRAAEFWGVGPETAVAHLGGGLPAGADALAAHGARAVPGLASVRGGPIAIAYRRPKQGVRALLVVNRDARGARSFELRFDPRVVAAVAPVSFDASQEHFVARGPLGAAVHLPPGGALGLKLTQVEEIAGRP